MNTFDKLFLGSDVDYEDDDVLILGGGNDVNPKLYNSSPHYLTQMPNDRRDKRNYEQIGDALFSKKPIIGVCRGLQILNVYFGGTLHQHVEDTLTRPMIDVFYKTGHRFLARASHHQACKVVGGDGIIIGTSSNPFVFQAIYWPKENVLGVQWHPEYSSKDSPDNQWLKYFINTYMEK